MTASELTIAEALAQVELGFHVFALGRNSKVPVTDHGWKNATGKPEWVRKQLEGKTAGNYGMVWPIEDTPLVVAFDLDDGKDGPQPGEKTWLDRIKDLTDRLGPLPKTKQTKTPSGGRHMFVRWPAGTPLPPGDEALGFTMRYPARHYVVGPGSRVGGRTYESNDLPVADLPPKWVDAILAEQSPAKPLITIHGDGYQLPDYVGQGHRYSTVRDYSASKWAQGLKLEEIWALVKSKVAPLFTVPKSEADLRADFERAMKKIEDRWGPQPRKGMSEADVIAAVSPIPYVKLSDIAVEAVVWLWHRHLPIGSITLFDGNPGEGKSTVVADLIARLTVGGSWPDDTPVGLPGQVLYITKEDDPATQVRPRIEAAGGDVSRVVFVAADLLFPRDIGRFRELLLEVKPRLVLLDPLMSYLEGKVRAISDNEVRSAIMTPLADVAREIGCATLVIRHFNKGTGQSALNRGAGTLGGLAGAARMVLSLTTHPGDEDARVFGVVKTNYEAKPTSLKVAIEAAQVEGFQMTVSRAKWLGNSDVSITDAMEQTSLQHEELVQAMDDLSDILDPRDNVEPVPSQRVKAQMKARGHSSNVIDRARKKLGIVVRNTSTVPRTTTWMLPTISIKTTGTTSHPSRMEAI